MENAELLKKVLSDYCATNEELRFQEAMLAQFCDYAAEWIRTKGLIGVGQTAEGLSIRFADGQEYVLFQPAAGLINGPAVSVTGTVTKIEKGIGESTASFPITGR